MRGGLGGDDHSCDLELLYERGQIEKDKRKTEQAEESPKRKGKSRRDDLARDLELLSRAVVEVRQTALQVMDMFLRASFSLGSSCVSKTLLF